MVIPIYSTLMKLKPIEESLALITDSNTKRTLTIDASKGHTTVGFLVSPVSKYL